MRRSRAPPRRVAARKGPERAARGSALIGPTGAAPSEPASPANPARRRPCAEQPCSRHTPTHVPRRRLWAALTARAGFDVTYGLLEAARRAVAVWRGDSELAGAANGAAHRWFLSAAEMERILETRHLLPCYVLARCACACVVCVCACVGVSWA
jgi:hypothetical protein